MKQRLVTVYKQWRAFIGITLLSFIFPTVGFGQVTGSCTVIPGQSIQACVDFVATQGGGTVYLRAGTHTLTTFIHLHSDNISLLGEGRATILFLADEANASPILIGRSPEIVNPDEEGETPVRNISVQSLSIDANRQGQAGEFWTAHPHISISGITIRQGENTTLRDVVVTQSPSAGILVEKSTIGFLLDAVELRESAFDGFSCNKSSLGQVVDSRLVDNVFAGLTATCDCSDNIFSNNIIADNGTDGVAAPGIFFSEAHRNLVAGNLIDSNGDVGILLSGADCGVTETGASLNYFALNRVTRHAPQCGVFVSPPTTSTGGAGPGNVAFGTFYEGNECNVDGNTDPLVFEDIGPVER